MTPDLIKKLILLGFGAFVALVLGLAISVQGYELIVLPLMLALVVATILIPGYAFLIAFGLTCPFAVPLPFVWGMPMLLLMIGLCVLKFIVRRAMGVERLAINWSSAAAIFFGWVLIRYCMNPVMPGVAIGSGIGITGFRAYMNFALCAALFLMLGLFKSTLQIRNLVRWICVLSGVYICVFVPLMFTKSLGVAYILSNLGIFVDFFENGWLRFVILPDFGLALICAALLPNLFNLKKVFRVTLFVVGLAAVLLGGSRSSALMFFTVAVIFAYLRYRSVGLAAIGAILGVCLFALYYIGENYSTQDPALYRIASLVSPRAADETGAAATVEWRKVRWERAMEDIREHPLIGMSYGGLENAFVFANGNDFERARLEMDVASGGIHNGYLANARALGIPSLIFFIAMFTTQIFKQARQALKLKGIDPLARDLHTYLWINLTCVAIHIYIGIDLNDPQLWCFMGLCTLLPRLKLSQQPESPKIEGRQTLSAERTLAFT